MVCYNTPAWNQRKKICRVEIRNDLTERTVGKHDIKIWEQWFPITGEVPLMIEEKLDSCWSRFDKSVH